MTTKPSKVLPAEILSSCSGRGTKFHNRTHINTKNNVKSEKYKNENDSWCGGNYSVIPLEKGLVSHIVGSFSTPELVNGYFRSPISRLLGHNSRLTVGLLTSCEHGCFSGLLGFLIIVSWRRASMTETSTKTKGEEEEPTSVFLPSAARVAVHPLVLLSLVDHFARMNNKANVKKRVVGLLLGRYKEDQRGEVTLDISNSFAVPFDEDTNNSEVWFFDQSYADEMYIMQRHVFPQLRVVGWYSSGPAIQPNDMLLHVLIADRFCPNPVYCVVNTDQNNKGVPVMAYTTVQANVGARALEFRNIPTVLGFEPAEEIGIEHLLRDVTDSTITNLSTQIQERELSLTHLSRILGQIEDYLADVAKGVMPMSEDVLGVLQELISLQPEIFMQKTSTSMIRHTNDQAISTFLAALGRLIGTIHMVLVNRRTLARELKDIQQRKNQQSDSKMNHEKSKITEAASDGANTAS
eukprot:gene13373-9200_t